MSNAAHPKRIAKACQSISLQNVKADFGERLRQAFGGASNAEIARKLGLSGQSVVTKWMAGKLPTAEALVEIYRITKVNTHWLLTGEGEESSDPLRILDDRARAAVQLIARNEKKSAEEVLDDLVREALMKRGADLFLLGNRLRAGEIEELRILAELVSEPPAVAGGPRVSTEGDSDRTQRRKVNE